MKDKVDVPRPLGVVLDEVFISRRSLLLRVAREHALQTDAHALHIVYGTPAGTIEKVEADDAVGVDVRVPGYWVRIVLDENYFGCLKYGQLVYSYGSIWTIVGIWRKSLKVGGSTPRLGSSD